MDQTSRSLYLFIFKISLCVMFVGVFLFLLIDRTNQLIQIRKEIPIVEKELKKIQLQNEMLQYQIQTFENPKNLLKLLDDPQFWHLKFQNQDEVIILRNKSSHSGS